MPHVQGKTQDQTKGQEAEQEETFVSRNRYIIQQVEFRRLPGKRGLISATNQAIRNN